MQKRLEPGYSRGEKVLSISTTGLWGAFQIAVASWRSFRSVHPVSRRHICAIRTSVCWRSRELGGAWESAGIF